MKIIALRRKLITSSIISAILVAVNIAIFIFLQNIKEDSSSEIKKIKRNISSINSRISEIESKKAQIEKYKFLWQSLEEKHKDLTGIKVEIFNEKLKEISEKFLVTTSDVKISLPEIYKDGVFKRDTFNMYFTSVSIKYSAISDVLAMSFANEFVNSLNGYPIVTYFNIQKNRNYSEKDLIDISYGKMSGAISGRLEFFWYVPKSL